MGRVHRGSGESAGAQPAACVHLERDAEEWEAFLGGGEQAGAARGALLAELGAAGTATLNGFTNHLRELGGALKAAARNF